MVGSIFIRTILAACSFLLESFASRSGDWPEKVCTKVCTRPGRSTRHRAKRAKATGCSDNVCSHRARKLFKNTYCYYKQYVFLRRRISWFSLESNTAGTSLRRSLARIVPAIHGWQYRTSPVRLWGFMAPPIASHRRLKWRASEVCIAVVMMPSYFLKSMGGLGDSKTFRNPSRSASSCSLAIRSS
jgi:hypothetical protein